MSPLGAIGSDGAVATKQPVGSPPVRDEDFGWPPSAIESYSTSDTALERTLLRADGSTTTQSLLPHPSDLGRRIRPEDAERSLLQSRTPPSEDALSDEATLVDLFSGCGGLSLGVVQALGAVGVGSRCVGVDIDGPSRCVYARNLPSARVVDANVAEVFGGRADQALTSTERRLADEVGEVDFLLGGPPCQGHSAFNNRTRHDDPKNALYLSMVRAARVLSPRHVIIENVPGALNDRSRVVQRAIAGLDDLGYAVSHAVVNVSSIGVAQSRKRFVVAASRDRTPDLGRAMALHARPRRTVRWAIEDLADEAGSGPFDTPANSAPQTRARINRLFEDSLYDLPDSARPPCHRGGGHSYRSIYGRLRWDEPAQTITTGFYSMCMGRNVHPSRRRTITAREAARLQSFPDWFAFDVVKRRTDLARLIGNAVPPRLAFAAAIELVR